MYLEDIGRLVVVAVVIYALVTGFGLAYENHTLTQTNAELSRFVTTKLDSLEAELTSLKEFQRAGIEALRSGRPGAYIEVLERAAAEDGA